MGCGRPPRNTPLTVCVTVVNAWNSLPDHVVLSETVNTFKSRLDKFWQHQDMIYDFHAELHGTGSRSLHYN